MERYVIFNKVNGKYFKLVRCDSFNDSYDMAVAYGKMLDNIGKPHMLSIYDCDDGKTYHIDFEFTDFDI